MAGIARDTAGSSLHEMAKGGLLSPLFCERVDTVDPHSLRGLSRRIALTRCQLRNPGAFGRTDFWDADHVHFSAYVDVAVLDRRSFNHLMSESKKPHGRVAGGPPANIRRCADINALIEMLA